jgi:hypothetical protein
MKLRKALSALIRVIIDEAERNPDFARRIEETLALEAPRAPMTAAISRPANRRASALLDPVDLARQGEEILRSRLAELNLEQLKDVVAEYGMDSGKLVLKWKTPTRMIDHIVDFAIRRVRKGEAFLS